MYVGASAAQYSWSIPPLPSEPRAGEGGGHPQGLGQQAGCCQLFVWVGRLQLHTQLPIIYVGTHTITNCLCTWEPPQPNIAGPFHPPPPPPPPQTPPPPANYLCRVGLSSRTHTITNCLCTWAQSWPHFDIATPITTLLLILFGIFL